MAVGGENVPRWGCWLLVLADVRPVSKTYAISFVWSEDDNFQMIKGRSFPRQIRHRKFSVDWVSLLLGGVTLVMRLCVLDIISFGGEIDPGFPQATRLCLSSLGNVGKIWTSGSSGSFGKLPFNVQKERGALGES